MALRNSLALTGSITANSFFLSDGSSVSGSLTVSDTPPAGAKNGSLWLNSNNLNTYVYYTDGDSSQWVSAGSIVSGSSTIPVQTGNSGKYLTTNGSDLSWSNVSALPTQTDNSGKYLTTNGSAASWANVSSFTASQAYTMSILFGGS